MTKIILSASRIKQFQDCSWLFYHTYFLKVPENTHPKTLIGSLAHLILELLFIPRHRHHYELIKNTRSVYSSPAMARLIRNFLKKNPVITEEIAAPLNDIVFVALDYDFFQDGAVKVFDPEFYFEMGIVGDITAKGFIDRFALYETHAVIRDFKTQGKKFTAKELAGNIQAHLYQYCIKKKFGLPARVEFILLRHPPTAKDPTKHLQVVEPLEDAHFEGMSVFLEEVHKQMEALDENSAMDNLRACNDQGFCDRVCQLKHPFEYYQIEDMNGKIIKTSRGVIAPNKDQKLVMKKYEGCGFFYSKNGVARSLSREY